MKTSVVVIAHNEELTIINCVESLLHQTLVPEEIIVVIHNCSDSTEALLTPFKTNPIIHLDIFNGDQGIVSARVRGISQATGDIILCIDGDAYAKKNIVEVVTGIFVKKLNVVLVGPFVRIHGNLFWNIASLLNYFIRIFDFLHPEGWIWGAGFAFRKKHQQLVLSTLLQAQSVARQINSKYTAEDFWLALTMKKIGKLHVTNKTSVDVPTKESSWKDSWKRHNTDVERAQKLHTYQKENF